MNFLHRFALAAALLGGFFVSASSQTYNPDAFIVVSPDNFGAAHNGFTGCVVGSTCQDDAPAIDAAMSVLSTAGHGILSLTPGATYEVCSLSTNKLSTVRAISNVTIQGNGATIQWCNNLVRGGSAGGFATFTGTVSSGSPNITSITAISGTIAAPGTCPAYLINVPTSCNMISGPAATSGVPFGASILSCSGGPPVTACVMSANATANGTITITQSTTMFNGIYATGNLANFTINNLILDLNGTNNSCGGTCGGQNAAIGAGAAGQTCSNIHITSDTILNNPGSNNLLFGAQTTAPNCTDVFYLGNYSSFSGDGINPAEFDHSTYSGNATNFVGVGNSADHGAALYGTFAELHGIGVTWTGNTANSYSVCLIISNEPSVTTQTVTATTNSCQGVNVGAALASFAAGNLIDIQINSNIFSFNTSTAGSCFDGAGSLLGGNVVDYQFNHNKCSTPGQGTSNTLSAPGIKFSFAKSVQFVGNHISSTEGPCIISTNGVQASEVIEIKSNVLDDCGLSNTGANQIGINLVSSGSVPASVTVDDNTIAAPTALRTLVTGIADALSPAAGGGQVINNHVSAATTSYSVTASNTYLLAPTLLAALTSSSVGNPANITSTSFQMEGFGSTCKITPGSTGKVTFNISAAVAQTTAGDSFNAQAAFGTGAAPANAAAASGTVFTSQANGNGTITNYGLQNFTGTVTGLTVGTAYWFDLQVEAVTAGAVALSSVRCSASEIP